MSNWSWWQYEVMNVTCMLGIFMLSSQTTLLKHIAIWVFVVGLGIFSYRQGYKEAEKKVLAVVEKVIKEVEEVEEENHD